MLFSYLWIQVVSKLIVYVNNETEVPDLNTLPNLALAGNHHFKHCHTENYNITEIAILSKEFSCSCAQNCVCNFKLLLTGC